MIKQHFVAQMDNNPKYTAKTAKLKAERSTNKQQLKMATAKSQQSILRKEMQDLVMSMGYCCKTYIISIVSRGNKFPQVFSGEG